ncbi:MAG: hypothetical protein QOH70_1177 [Blastocatellia bacterium]|jgi:hypothetical protein|nr:hypothetical protein [Blastocatellia bacterium]
MKNKTMYVTLLACAVTAFLFTLVRYLLVNGNPANRLGYGIFISIAPAIGALIVLKLAKLSRSWKWTAALYGLLFMATSIVQFFGRVVPIK